MKCKSCGFENKDEAKFCTKCGSSLDNVPKETPEKSDSSKYIIIAFHSKPHDLLSLLGTPQPLYTHPS